MLINLMNLLRAAVSTVLAQCGSSASASGSSAAERALASFLGCGMSGWLLDFLRKGLERGQAGGWLGAGPLVSRDMEMWCPCCLTLFGVATMHL
jgi:hypothetical protein